MSETVKANIDSAVESLLVILQAAQETLAHRGFTVTCQTEAGGVVLTKTVQVEAGDLRFATPNERVQA